MATFPVEYLNPRTYRFLGNAATIMNMKNFFSPAKLKEKLEEYRRVIAVSRKPDREEFLSTARITALGISVLGAAGLVIYMLYYLLLPIVA